MRGQSCFFLTGPSKSTVRSPSQATSTYCISDPSFPKPPNRNATARHERSSCRARLPSCSQQHHVRNCGLPPSSSQATTSTLVVSCALRLLPRSRVRRCVDHPHASAIAWTWARESGRGCAGELCIIGKGQLARTNSSSPTMLSQSPGAHASAVGKPLLRGVRACPFFLSFGGVCLAHFRRASFEL